MLRKQRVSESEVLSAVRGAGLARLEDAGAVVLETDGTFSVVPADALRADGVLAGFGDHPGRDRAAG